jgi:hypothetical protein
MEGKSPIDAPRTPPEIPNIRDLATLYRKAIEKSDHRLAGVAETAVMRLALAESAISEARAMHTFLSESSK